VVGPPAVPPVLGPPTNHAPAYTDDPTNTTQDVTAGAQLAPLAATDPDGDQLTYALVDGTLPPGVLLTASGAFVGNPEAAGSYPVVLRVCDDGTPQLCTTTSLVIAVRGIGPVTSPPVTPPASPTPTPVVPPASPRPSPTPAEEGVGVANASPLRPLPRTGAPLAALLLLGLGTLVLGLGFSRAGRRPAYLTD
jgi:hypothetical protein